MRPITLTQTGVGTTKPEVMNWRGSPGGFQIGFGCVVTGTVTYTVEHCFDNLLAGETPTWFPHTTVAAQTANKDGNYAFPIFALRINVTSGTGTVVGKFLQTTSGI
jgi:hypothetical protein